MFYLFAVGVVVVVGLIVLVWSQISSMWTVLSGLLCVGSVTSKTFSLRGISKSVSTVQWKFCAHVLKILNFILTQLLI